MGPILKTLNENKIIEICNDRKKKKKAKLSRIAASPFGFLICYCLLLFCYQYLWIIIFFFRYYDCPCTIASLSEIQTSIPPHCSQEVQHWYWFLLILFKLFTLCFLQVILHLVPKNFYYFGIFFSFVSLCFTVFKVNYCELERRLFSCCFNLGIFIDGLIVVFKRFCLIYNVLNYLL